MVCRWGYKGTILDNSLNCASFRDSDISPPLTVVHICWHMWWVLWGITLTLLLGLRSSFFQLLGVLADDNSQQSPTPGIGLDQNSPLTQGHISFLWAASTQLQTWGVSNHPFCLRIRQFKRVISASGFPVGLAETFAEMLSKFSSSLCSIPLPSLSSPAIIPSCQCQRHPQ